VPGKKPTWPTERWGACCPFEPRLTIAQFDNPTRFLRIPMAKPRQAKEDDEEESEDVTGCNFDLGYAITTFTRAKGRNGRWSSS
jgi:hypothetical protein